MNVRFVKNDRMDAARDGDGEVLGAEGIDVLTVPMNSSVHRMEYMGEQEGRVTQDMFEQVTNTLEAFNSNGSGWVLSDILSFDVQVMQCQPLNGGCTSHSVTFVRQAGMVIDHLQGSIQNCLLDANRCFFRAVARGILQCEKNEPETERVLEEFIHANIVENISSPVHVRDIETFEQANQHLNLAINVLFEEEGSGDLYPARASKNIGPDCVVVNLVLFHMAAPERQHDDDETVSGGGGDGDAEAEEEKSPAIMHYAWIPDIGKALGKNKKDKNNHWYSKPAHLCYNCFLRFQSLEALQSHHEWCLSKTGQINKLPFPGEKVSYTSRSREVMYPYFFVYDFETYNKPVARGCSCSDDKIDKCTHKTKIITEQQAFAYGFVMVDRYGKVVESLSYIGDDAAEHFVQTLLEVTEKYREYVHNTNIPLKETPEMLAAYENATTCYMCDKPFCFDKVKDHDHLSGEYLGAAHNRCNLLRVEVKDRIVGYAHNANAYDTHEILRALATRTTENGELEFRGKPISLDVIALNKQKVKTLTINKVTLLDSMAFLSDSLDRLVTNLKSSNHKFPLTRQWMEDDAKIALLNRKGCYPYEYMTGSDRLKETKLPPPDKFASQLGGSAAASPEDYAHACNVWRTFECKNLEDYTRLYVLADCYQLLECLSEFRTTLFETFRLDMCHYWSLPMMSKDMLFKMTGAEVDLLTDPEMIHFVKDNIR